MLPALMSHLQVEDMRRLHNALFILRVIAKRYQLRRIEHWGPMHLIVASVAPVMHSFLTMLLSYVRFACHAAKACSVTSVIGKTRWRLPCL